MWNNKLGYKTYVGHAPCSSVKNALYHSMTDVLLSEQSGIGYQVSGFNFLEIH
jgi:hypothetical protein